MSMAATSVENLGAIFVDPAAYADPARLGRGLSPVLGHYDARGRD